MVRLGLGVQIPPNSNLEKPKRFSSLSPRILDMFLLKTYRLCIFPFCWGPNRNVSLTLNKFKVFAFLEENSKIIRQENHKHPPFRKHTPKKSNLSTDPSNLTTYDFNKTLLVGISPKKFPQVARYHRHLPSQQQR